MTDDKGDKKPISKKGGYKPTSNPKPVNPPKGKKGDSAQGKKG